MKDAPPASTNPGCCEKLALLWYTNKPLAVFLMVITSLIFLGIVFAILWFFVIHHINSSY